MTLKRLQIIQFSSIFILVAAIAFVYVFRPTKDCVCNDKSKAELTAQTIVSNYENNETKANEEYLGKVITVSGTISSLKTDEKERTIVELDAESMGVVSCTLCEKASNEVNLTIGTSVQIKGECVGYTFDVILIKCCIND
jgi:hypothetical protein